jgi:hypothetical protein
VVKFSVKKVKWIIIWYWVVIYKYFTLINKKYRQGLTCGPKKKAIILIPVLKCGCTLGPTGQKKKTQTQARAQLFSLQRPSPPAAHPRFLQPCPRARFLGSSTLAERVPPRRHGHLHGLLRGCLPPSRNLVRASTARAFDCFFLRLGLVVVEPEPSSAVARADASSLTASLPRSRSGKHA